MIYAFEDDSLLLSYLLIDRISDGSSDAVWGDGDGAMERSVR